MISDPRHRLPYWLIIGLVLALVLSTAGLVITDLVGLSNTVDIGLPVPISVYAQVAASVASVVLTLALVLLYGEQTRIQRRQEDWMEAEHVPDVFVDSWEITGDEFRFRLSNLGTGIAKNLQVGFEITPSADDRSDIIALRGEAVLFQQDLATRVLPRASNAGENPVPMRGRYDLTVLREGREERPRRIGGTGTGNRTGERFGKEKARDELTAVLTELAESVDAVTYTVSLRYDYIRRESDRKSVFGGRAELEPELDLEGLLLTTVERYETDLDVQPDNLRAPE